MPRFEGMIGDVVYPLEKRIAELEIENEMRGEVVQMKKDTR